MDDAIVSFLERVYDAITTNLEDSAQIFVEVGDTEVGHYSDLEEFIPYEGGDFPEDMVLLVNFQYSDEDGESVDSACDVSWEGGVDDDTFEECVEDLLSQIHEEISEVYEEF